MSVEPDPESDYTADVVVYPPAFMGGLKSEDVGALDHTPPLFGGGGGGRFDGMTWQEALQRVDDKVDSNFKWILGVFGGGFALLIGAFATGYILLSADGKAGNQMVLNKLEAISTQLGEVRTDVAVLKATAPEKRR